MSCLNNGTYTAIRKLGFIALLTASAVFFACTLGVSGDDARPAEDRPEESSGTGFFISDGKLYDSNGNEFIMKGVNANHWWNNGDNTLLSIPYIKTAGANSVRLVFGENDEEAGHEYYQTCKTTAEKQAVVEEYIKYHIVPIVEYHNGTGLNDPVMVDEAVEFWKTQSWVKTYEKYVILNITNEWCKKSADENGDTGSDELWRDTYLDAVAELREAGFKNCILIDSINYAGYISALTKYANDLLEADPEHNLLFSVHMYGGWYAPDSSDTENRDGHWHIDKALEELQSLEIPVIVGEFSRICAAEWDDDSAEDSELIETLQDYNTGWLFWMWYNSSGSQQNMVFNTAGNVYTENGKTIVSYLADSDEATCFEGDVPELPEPPQADPNWNPGTVTVVISNDWWMEASVENNDEVASVILVKESGETYAMTPQWGKHTLNVNLAENGEDLLDQNIYFKLYSDSGSIAITETKTLVDDAEFDIK